MATASESRSSCDRVFQFSSGSPFSHSIVSSRSVECEATTSGTCTWASSRSMWR